MILAVTLDTLVYSLQTNKTIHTQPRFQVVSKTRSRLST